MTRETKIGLLVGLAFITLFGIILSQAGSRRRAVLPPSLAPGRQPVVPLANTPPLARAEPRHQSPNELLGQAARPASGAVHKNPASPEQAAGSTVAALPQPSAAKKPPAPQLPAALAEQAPAARLASASDHASGPTDQTNPPSLPTKTPQAARARKPAAPMRSYIVRKNDNLTTIARRLLGTGSRQAVLAIYQANRDRLSDLDHLRVGQELRIPRWPARSALQPVEHFAPALVHARQRPAAPASPQPGSGQPQRGRLRSYQIKPGDTWQRIARRELADPQRWRELYELNRAIFPDPHRIRAGVRVRLPTRRDASPRLAQPAVALSARVAAR